jgi:hypothetical protein
VIQRTQFQDLAKARSVVDARGCWRWQGAKTSAGYAAVWFGGQTRSLNRLLLDEMGQDVRGLVIRHRCDVPPCVNPEHLSVGTQRSNILDAKIRNRLWFKITIAEAQEIRARYAAGGISQYELAHEYEVNQATISSIVTNRTRRPIKLTVLR